MIHMTLTYADLDAHYGFGVVCRCGWTAAAFPTVAAARRAGDAHLAEANQPEETRHAPAPTIR